MADSRLIVLFVLACAHPKPAPLPECASAEHAQMTRALAIYCDAHQCAHLAVDFAACKTEWREGDVVRPEYRPAILAIDLLDGAWQGALFRRIQGAWEVIALDGGDIR